MTSKKYSIPIDDNSESDKFDNNNLATQRGDLGSAK
jgi:hypothetical protein